MIFEISASSIPCENRHSPMPDAPLRELTHYSPYAPRARICVRAYHASSFRHASAERDRLRLRNRIIVARARAIVDRYNARHCILRAHARGSRDKFCSPRVITLESEARRGRKREIDRDAISIVSRRYEAQTADGTSESPAVRAVLAGFRALSRERNMIIHYTLYIIAITKILLI